MATTLREQAPCAPDCFDKPVQCPDCGALECLCRPRFFAGQLLTEDDLNRLDHYIRKKHQLHNLNLHGWGVVNGLQVLCDPCGQIKVTKGYAVDPCGNDIVVCCDTPVKVCDLIKHCKDIMRKKVDCTPFSRPAFGCEELEEEWILAVRYCEQPTRGITALRGGGCETVSECAPSAHCGDQAKTECCSTCGRSNCSCAGGCGPGCCGGGKGQTARTQKRGAPPECEPTVICEGYRFEVFRKPEPAPHDPGSDDDGLFDFEFDGPLIERFNCCAKGLIAVIPQPPGEFNLDEIQSNQQAWHQWCCRTREGLIGWLERQPTTNCELICQLQQLRCPTPDPNDVNFAQRIIEVATRYLLVLIDELLNCLCLALLPPAPEPTDDPRVPLASVKVRGPDCKVVSVCNWTECRRIMTTWPAVCYWWSVVPIGQLIRRVLDQLCCASLELNVPAPTPDPSTPTPGTPDNPIPGAVPVDAQPGSGAARATNRLNPQYDAEPYFASMFDFFSHSIARGRQPLDAAAFASSISRLRLPAAGGGGLNGIERTNLAPFLLLNSIARPLGHTVQHALPDRDGGFDFGGLMSLLGVAGGPPRDDTVADLKERIDRLETELAKQKRTVAGLRSQRKKKS